MAILKPVRNTLLAIAVLCLLALASGVMYVAFFDHPATQIPLAVTNDVSSGGLLHPTPPNPNARESAAVESLTLEAKAGSLVSVIIKTNATSTCTIAANFVSSSSHSALVSKIADDYGDVAWSWQLAANAPIGSQTITVTCVYHGRAAVVQGTFNVVE